MNMHLIDWTILIGFLVFITLGAIVSLRYTRSVADFLAANRCAGRYLLTNAYGMVVLGASTIISQFQVYYENGFTGLWWGNILAPVTLVVTLSGWVVYRWRETRILSMAQLFELRYSKSYRIFAGVLAFVAGVFPLCIFPSIGAHFAIHFMGLPQGLYVPIMAFLVGAALALTFMGGQIAVLLTDFFQAIFCSAVLLVILGAIFILFDWPTIMEGLSQAPEEASMLHPFHTGETYNYGASYYIILVFSAVFIWPVGSWNQAPNASARNAHEARMATILSGVRGILIWTIPVLLAICAYVIMHHPDYAETAQRVEQLIAHETTQVQRQVRVPVALAQVLPAGLIGAFAAVMLAAFISTNDSYFHLFGGMFIQDVILPFRKTPFKPETHVWLLRGAIAGVAVLAFLLALVFEQKQDIQMFWALAASFGAGAIAIPMLGALYWSRATTIGAWSSAVVGMVGTLISAYLTREVSDFTVLGRTPNAQELGLVVSLMAGAVFIAVSLLDSVLLRKRPANMDKLLHRGAYALDDDAHERFEQKSRWQRLLGIGDEFTLGDKAIYLGILGWNGINIVIFIGGTIYNLLVDTGDAGWGLYWQISLYITFIVAVLTTIWLTAGGLRDMVQLFKTLSETKRNLLDDGMVVDDHNLGEPDPETLACKNKTS